MNLLQVAETGDASQLIRDMRVRSLFSPYYFIKVVLNYPSLVDHLHQYDSELFIERWLNGVQKQWIEWPRGFFKSTTFTIGTGIWIVLPNYDPKDTEYALEVLHLPEREWFDRLALHDQDCTQLLAFETIDNAKKKVKEIKWHFEQNMLFRSVFPEIAFLGSEDPWNNDCVKIRRRTDAGRRAPEGTFEAIGVNGALQSRHYKIVWEDDLVGMKATRSEAVMEETIRWHELLHGAFEDATRQIRFGVSNRWGWTDLNSYIREKEDFVFYTRSAWELDEEGKEVAIFPERFPMEELQRIQGTMTPYDFSCQYMNRPRLPGAVEVDLQKIHRYRVYEDRIHCDCGKVYHPNQLLRFIHYDPYNARGKRSRSCPAIVVIGTASDKHVFVLEVFSHKGSYKEIFDKQMSLIQQWRPFKFTYEDVGHQNMGEYHLRERAATEGLRLPPIIGVPPHGKGMEIRVRDYLFPFVNRGQISIHHKMLSVIQQFEEFPTERFDHDYDILDAMAQGATLWTFPIGDEEEERNKAEEDAYLAELGKPFTHRKEMYVA